MTRITTGWVLAGLLCLALWPAVAHAQSTQFMEAYERYSDLYVEGRYEEALPFAEEALRLGEREFGPDHEKTAALLGSLAEVNRALGRYADAVAYAERALAIREKALGADHPDLAPSLEGLAKLYRAEGRYADAEPLEKQASAIRAITGQATPDPEGQRLWESHIAAGQEAYQRGDYAGAERWLTAALQKAQEFGFQDSRLALSLNNLAGLYQAQGRHAEAEHLYQRALTIGEKVLGPDHPSVATRLNNLAALYRAQGRRQPRRREGHGGDGRAQTLRDPQRGRRKLRAPHARRRGRHARPLSFPSHRARRAQDRRVQGPHSHGGGSLVEFARVVNASPASTTT